MKIKSEFLVQRHLKRYLSALHHQILIEYPIFSRIIDLVYIDKKKNEIIAVEIKLRNFKELIEQINFCKHFANKVFIAIPKTIWARTKIYKELSDDIGIITFEKMKNKIIF